MTWDHLGFRVITLIYDDCMQMERVSDQWQPFQLFLDFESARWSAWSSGYVVRFVI
jgi:hypothetical protein